jgi:signal peptidase
MKNLKLIFAFAIGFLSCFFVIYSLSFINLEQPLQVGGFKQFSSLADNSSPRDWISSRDIEVYDNKIVINVENPSISSYASTGSMRPVLDAGHNGIRIIPSSAENIKQGDIISFQKGNDLIIHRVMEKGKDENGIWFITKGDNNLQSDGKVYFKDVKYVTIGVLY